MMVEEVLATFAARLRLLRRERGLTQEALGEQLGLSKGSIGGYETEIGMPRADQLPKFAEFFGVSLDFLMGRSETRDPDCVKAFHVEDGHEGPLPPEAEASVKAFREFIQHTWPKDKPAKPPVKE